MMTHNPYTSSATGAAVSHPATAASTTIRLIKQLSSCHRSLATPPPTKDLQEATAQLESRRDVTWTAELATNLGSMLARHLASSATSQRNDNDPETRTSFETFKVDQNSSSIHYRQSLIFAMLKLLVTAMEDWEDHIIYSVLMQESSSSANDDGDKSCHEASSRYENLTNNQENRRTIQNRINLLTILSKLSTSQLHGEAVYQIENLCSNGVEKIRYFQDPIQRISMTALALSWQSLQRLHQTMELVVTSPKDETATPWWIDDDTAAVFAPYCMALLRETFDDDQQQLYSYSQLEIDQWRLGALIISGTMLYYGIVTKSSDCELQQSNEQLSEIISKLIKRIQMLNHPVLPPSASEYTLPIALMSMNVISILKYELEADRSTTNGSIFHGFNQTIQSTRLVENVVNFSFSELMTTDAATHHVSRWVHPSTSRFAKKKLTQFFGMQVILCWKHYDSLAWKVVMKLHTHIELASSTFWKYVTSPEYAADKLETQLLGILWLHRHFPRLSRLQLLTVLEQFTAQGRTVQSASALLFSHLFGLLHNDSVISYSAQIYLAQLLRELFSSRRSIATQDELSDMLLGTLDERVIEKYFQSVLGYVSTDDSNQPRLLSVLDLLAILLEEKQTSSAVMSKLDAGKLESFLFLIKPGQLRYDFVQTKDDSLDGDSETPPLNNLSRLDETSICMEVEDAKEPRGIDQTVRLSAALAVANLAQTSASILPDETSAVLVSRIMSAVNDFVDSYQRIVDKGDDPNAFAMDTSRRNVRLQRCIAFPENETFLASMMSTSGILRNKRFADINNRNTHLQLEVDSSHRRNEMTRKAHAEVVHQLEVQSLIFRRNINRIRVNAAQDAQQLMSLHATRRSHAEEQANAHLQELEKIKSNLHEALAVQQNLREAAEKAISERDREFKISEEVRETNAILDRAVQSEKQQHAKLVEQFKQLQGRLHELEGREENLQQTISERNIAVVEAHNRTDALHDNLEDLFADMCNLAQIIEHNESQIAAEKKMRISAMKESEEKLVVERNRNQELNARVQGLQKDHDKLYRKLGKYKERLAYEISLKTRREEEDQRRKRNGPVSYINSLHTSTLSDKNSSRDHRSQRNSSVHSRSSHDAQNRTSSIGCHHSSRSILSSAIDKENRGSKF